MMVRRLDGMLLSLAPGASSWSTDLAVASRWPSRSMMLAELRVKAPEEHRQVLWGPLKDFEAGDE